MTRPRLGNVAVTGAVSTGAIEAAHERGRSEVLRTVDPRTLTPSPFQPRGAIDPANEAFISLVESVRAHGILQPPTVRELAGGALELLAGERRTRAAIAAGLATIPVRVRAHVSDADARALALLENLAREDLTAWETARGLAELRDTLTATGAPATVRDLAAHVGKSRSAVGRLLQIADALTPDVVRRAGVPSWDTLPEQVLLTVAAGATPAERAALLRQMGKGYHAPAPGKRARKKPRTNPRGAAAPFTITGALLEGKGAVRIVRPVADFTPEDARALLDTLAPVVEALRARVPLDGTPHNPPHG